MRIHLHDEEKSMIKIIKNTTRLGHFMLKNRKKIFIGLGTIAFAGAVSGIVNYWKSRGSSRRGPENTRKKIPLAPSIHGHKKDIYKAPAISQENLTKH